jgi:hypothetical protein
MRAINIAILVLALCGNAVLAQSVGGTYTVHGKNIDGSPYGGTATITPSSDSTCRIAWKTGSTSNGICMLSGKSFAAAYVLNKSFGLVLYELQGDGSLKGVWTIADQPGAGTETLIPVK